MSMKTWLSSAVRAALGLGIDDIVSPQKKEQRGLKVARRFARGNTNVQHGRTVSESEQEKRLKNYVRRVESKSFFFLK